jgi:hypothetical protein
MPTPVWEQTTPVKEASRAEQIALDHSIAVAMAGDTEESAHDDDDDEDEDGDEHGRVMGGHGLPWSAVAPPRCWPAPPSSTITHMT